MEFRQWDNNVTLAVSTQKLLRDSGLILCLVGKMSNSTAWQRLGPWADIKGMVPSLDTLKEVLGIHSYIFIDPSLCCYLLSLVNTTILTMFNDDSLKQWRGCKSKETEGRDLFSGTYQNVKANATLEILKKITEKLHCYLMKDSSSSQNFGFVFHLQHYETQILISESNSI